MRRADPRRRSVVIAGIALAAMPWSGWAAGPRRVGFLGSATAAATSTYVADLTAGLARLGWRERVDYELITRHADGDVPLLPQLARELLGSGCEVIVTPGTSGIDALKAATSTTPIVFAFGIEPVRMGYADSLNRPGHNITGVYDPIDEIIPKQLQLLREIVPNLGRAAALCAPSVSVNAILAEIAVAAGRALKVPVTRVDVANARDIAPALRRAVAAGAQASIVLPNLLMQNARETLVGAAAALRHPLMYYDTLFVQLGGLASYSASRRETFTQVAGYVDRILRGADPATLPIEANGRYEFTINLHTARDLELEIPASVRLQADRLIS